MEGIRDTWRRMPGRSRLMAIAFPAIVAAAAAAASLAALGSPSRTPSSSPQTDAVMAQASPTDPPLPPEPSVDPSASAEPTPSPAPPGADPLLGTDGRFTVLLLGSDYRPAHPGNRTDAIMVVSVDPSTGKAAGFSIPRDTVDFPLVTGGVFRPKINALYQELQTRSGNGGVGLSRAISKALNVEIDGYVFIGFAGVKESMSHSTSRTTTPSTG
jgi:LytR_cpsA_psr family